MTQFLCVFVSILFIGAYVIVRPRLARTGPLLVDSFILGIGLYWVGAYTVMSTTTTAHVETVFEMSSLALISALSGAMIFAVGASPLLRHVQFTDLYADRSLSSLERPLVNGIALLSSVGAIYFVYLVFSSPILSQLLTLDNIIHYATLSFARNAIASGSAGYLAPGFVKQFRDVLLPLALFAMLILYERPVWMLRYWIVLAATLAAMLVNGQRSTIIALVLGLSMSAYFERRIRRQALSHPGQNVGRLVAAAVVALTVWILLSAALGRVSDEQSSITGVPVAAVRNLFDRVATTLPRENSDTYAVWSKIGPTEGRSWVVAFGTIFKTNVATDASLSTLSNELSAYIGHGRLGDSPLGLPPDIWLAWGWVGLSFVPALFVLFIGLLDLLLLSEHSAIFFASKIYLFIVMPLCVTPYLFVLNGGLTCMLLIAVVKVAVTARSVLPQKQVLARNGIHF